MRKENIYRELTLGTQAAQARELKLDWRQIEGSETTDPWGDDASVEESSAAESGFMFGAEEASDSGFYERVEDE